MANFDQTSINSEIHASLRRLEDADYTNNLIRDNETSILISQANEANSNLQAQIDDLASEVGQLHSYIETHIKDNDLMFFQDIDIGNIRVTDGGRISGEVLFDGEVTFGALVNANNGLEVLNALSADTITITDSDLYIDVGDIIFGNSDVVSPKTLTVDGVVQTAKIVATDDVSFSWVGLVQGSWSGQTQTYTVKSNGSNTTLASTTIAVTPSFIYDSTRHEYKIDAGVTDEHGNIVATTASSSWSGTQAYTDGGGGGTPEAHSHSAELHYLATVDGVPIFERTGGERIGTGTHTVYW